MRRIRARDNPLRRPRLTGQDQIKLLHVHQFQRHRHERKVLLIVLLRPRQSADECLANFVLPYLCTDFFGVVDMGDDDGVRIHVQERLKHLFAAAHTDKPIMNNRDFHEGQPLAPWPRAYLSSYRTMSSSPTYTPVCTSIRTIGTLPGFSIRWTAPSGI